MRPMRPMRPMRVMRLARALLLAAAIAGVAHAETRPRYGGTIDAPLFGAPGTLDPVLARTHADITAVGLVFDTLYRIAPDGTTRPHLAADEPVLDEKQTTVRIALRHGVHFQDGSDLTAADVAASLERTRARARWVLAPVLDVQADGDGVVLTLRAPVPDLTTLLALPQTAITRGGKPPGDRPIGSGPYAVASWDRAGKKLALRAFDDHFAGRPYADLVLHWFDTADGEASRYESGAAELSARGVAVFASSRPMYRADPPTEAPVPVLVFVGFGRAHALVTADRGFRAALDLAIARGGLATVTSGETVAPVEQPVPPPGPVVLDAATSAGDLDAARAQLTVAARRVPALAPGRLPALQLEILVDATRPDDRELAERVARALDRLGIASRITVRPPREVRDRVAAGQCDLWIGQLVEPLGLVRGWWSAAFEAGGDDWPLASLAAGTFDPAAAGKAFAERLPIVPLMFRGYKLWHRSDVRGVDFDGLGRPSYADMSFFGAPVRARR